MLQKALRFAMKAHEGQERKFQGLPYVWHPISVAKIVEIYKDSKSMDELRIAAILHDTVEDTDVTLPDVAEQFGYKVAQLVEELTSDGDEIRRIGKTNYLKKKLTNMSSWALVLKLSDRLDNVLDLEMVPAKFRQKYAAETEAIIDHIIKSRKLTDTHWRLIGKIREKLNELDFESVEA